MAGQHPSDYGGNRNFETNEPDMDEDGYLPYKPPWVSDALKPPWEKYSAFSDEPPEHGLTPEDLSQGLAPAMAYRHELHDPPRGEPGYFGEGSDDEPAGPFKVVGTMRLSLAKSFGILFGLTTAFYICYFIWSFFYDSITIFQLIQRGTSVMVFAYITYAIHSDIRSRVRYEQDMALYRQVGQLMQSEKGRGLEP